MFDGGRLQGCNNSSILQYLLKSQGKLVCHAEKLSI